MGMCVCVCVCVCVCGVGVNGWVGEIVHSHLLMKCTIYYCVKSENIQTLTTEYDC